MHLADLSAQKIVNEGFRCSCGKKHGGKTELYFGSEGEIAKLLAEKYPAHKTLFVTDRTGNARLRSILPTDPLTLYRQGESDVRELFGFPDTVSLAVACGSPQTVAYTRYFAFVRGIPCVVVCSDANAFSLFTRKISIPLLGESYRFTLDPPAVVCFCDEIARGEKNASVFLELAARSLCLLENKFARSVLEKPVCEELYELAFDVWLSLSALPSRSDRERALFEQSCRVALLREEGFYDVESEYLWETFSEEKKLSAWESLIDLYCLFFQAGKRRKYFVDDYLLRFEKAAILAKKSEFAISESCPLPHVRDIDRYEENFMRERKSLFRFAEELKRKKQSLIDGYGAFGGVRREEKAPFSLRLLPELSGEYGILSLMRDFGLLESRKDE